LTGRALVRDHVPFRLVVEPQEQEAYAARFGAERLLVLPFSNKGSSVPARNWIKDHSIAEGHERHWQLDDNMRGFYRFYKTKRLHCVAGIALRVIEDFVDRYENIAIAGMNYDMFCTSHRTAIPPFWPNVHVYSCTLILNRIPHRWRGRYNEDTDLCLQVLADGWCTVLFNCFLAKKVRTMYIKGGNTPVYQGDGRLRMARALERVWPGVVRVNRRFQRPQHIVFDAWKRFDTPLKLKAGVDLAKLPAIDEYGMELKVLNPVRSGQIKKLVGEHARLRRRTDAKASRKGGR
jgi:hypothetical protein